MQSYFIYSLDGNRLEYMEAETMSGLKHLKTLDLDNNPWRCDCRLRKFCELLTQSDLRKLYSVPLTCSGPERFSHRRWEELRPSDFACEPRVWLSAKSIQQEINGNVSLACLASGDPVPEVWWKLNGVPVNGTPYASGPNAIARRPHDEMPGESIVVYSTSLETREHQLSERWNNLTIYNASDADGGEYTCHARNIAGTAEGTTLVSIPRVFSAPTLSQTDNWLLWLSLAGGGGLALCASLGALLVALACLCSARGAGRRRAKRDKVKLQASASFGDQEKKLLDLSVTTTNSATASQQLHSQSGNDSSCAGSPCMMIEPIANNHHICHQLHPGHQHHQCHQQSQRQPPPIQHHQPDFELELEPRPSSHQHPSVSCSSPASVTIERLNRCQQPLVLNELPGLPTSAAVVTSANSQPVVLPAVPPSVLVSVSLAGPHCVRVASPEIRMASPAPERCYPDLLDIGLSNFATLPRRTLAGASAQRSGRELGSPYDNMGPRVTATGSSTFSLLDPELQLATAMPLIQPPPEFVSL
ncbi:hypothetical protein QAD02_014568 [Eretmocerus hayati]|uniref:Uncharacterized protein n=1 Tax=Eretmocerus hayati TaxID=131215 RepID=A0ACC2P6X8_9HYME|nr:hypothetical protein QAD02_014568 [Eretmocerus hayati]